MSNTTDYAAAFTEINENVKQFNELAQSMCELYEKKNNDYGDSFNTSCTKYGPVAALTRMSDKFNRIETLILKRQTQKVEDEKIEDTLIDLANYAMMTILWLRNNTHIDQHLMNKLKDIYEPEDQTYNVNVDSQKVE